MRSTASTPKGWLAQLVERLVYTENVRGSSPLPPTMDLGKSLSILGLAILLLGMYFNFLSHTNFPRIPGDIYIDKPNIKIYIPFTSAIVLSILLTLLFNFFKK